MIFKHAGQRWLLVVLSIKQDGVLNIFINRNYFVHHLPYHKNKIWDLYKNVYVHLRDTFLSNLQIFTMTLRNHKFLRFR